jgi:hypothetical protein
MDRQLIADDLHALRHKASADSGLLPCSIACSHLTNEHIVNFVLSFTSAFDSVQGGILRAVAMASTLAQQFLEKATALKKRALVETTLAGSNASSPEPLTAHRVRAQSKPQYA